MPLTDTQLVLLSAASQREDHLVVLPDHLKGGAAKKVIAKLVASSLVEEVRIERDQPAWRLDDEQQPVGLQLTAEGLKAIGVEGEDIAENTAPPHPESQLDAPATPLSPGSAGKTPREGSKQALLISLLERPQGATLDDLTSATGWLAHTTRAALTGLRQRGHAIERTRGEDGISIYRIPSPTPATAGSAMTAHETEAEKA
jgi:hypothetical protein